jgi:hypothetical protein
MAAARENDGQGQMGPDPAHPKVDQQHQLGPRQDADPQQGQAQADPGRRCCDRLPEGHPQHPGYADQTDNAYQGGWGAGRHLLQPHLEAAALSVPDLFLHRYELGQGMGRAVNGRTD